MITVTFWTYVCTVHCTLYIENKFKNLDIAGWESSFLKEIIWVTLMLDVYIRVNLCRPNVRWYTTFYERKKLLFGLTLLLSTNQDQETQLANHNYRYIKIKQVVRCYCVSKFTTSMYRFFISCRHRLNSSQCRIKRIYFVDLFIY